MSGFRNTAALVFLAACLPQALNASQLAEMKVLDKDYLMLHFKDGIVEFVDDGQGPYAYYGHHTDAENSKATHFGSPLNLAHVTEAGNWTIKSSDDSHYGQAGIAPTAVHRKSKVNGMSMGAWGSGDWIFDYTYEHFIYLRLPHSMEQGSTYTVEIRESRRSGTNSQSITYDIFNCPSEAIHTNLIGYMSDSHIKAADLYHFLGDGGSRDYSEFVGNDVFVYNIDTGQSQRVGSVAFWMAGKRETQHNLTGSDVWTVHFTGFDEPGRYRLAVEGIGCSEDSEIGENVYHDPYKVSVMGCFYMRIGQDNLDMTPVPRRPLFIPGQDPPNCKIFVTDMHPYHPDWDTFAGGDKWDKPTDWAPYKKSRHATNANAIGGHSDAADWDRHLGHVVNIYDLCLALARGAIVGRLSGQ